MRNLIAMCGLGVLWKQDAFKAETVLKQRNAFLETVRAHEGWSLDEEAAKTIFTELLTNVMRHSHSPVSVWLACRDGECKLHVLEFGPGFENEPKLPHDLAQGGRGLFLASAYSDELRIDGDPRGTYIIASLPRGARGRQTVNAASSPASRRLVHQRAPS